MEENYLVNFILSHELITIVVIILLGGYLIGKSQIALLKELSKLKELTMEHNITIMHINKKLDDVSLDKLSIGYQSHELALKDIERRISILEIEKNDKKNE